MFRTLGGLENGLSREGAPQREILEVAWVDRWRHEVVTQDTTDRFGVQQERAWDSLDQEVGNRRLPGAKGAVDPDNVAHGQILKVLSPVGRGTFPNTGAQERAVAWLRARGVASELTSNIGTGLSTDA